MFHPVSACADGRKALSCCWLYCSCLASWGHAFLRVSIAWLQPPHSLSLWPTSLLTTELYVWVMQLEAFAQLSCNLDSLGGSFVPELLPTLLEHCHCECKVFYPVAFHYFVLFYLHSLFKARLRKQDSLHPNLLVVGHSVDDLTI